MLIVFVAKLSEEIPSSSEGREAHYRIASEHLGAHQRGMLDYQLQELVAGGGGVG
jgi:hypothetical protein